MNTTVILKCEGAPVKRNVQTKTGETGQRLKYQLQDELVRSWLAALKCEQVAQARIKWLLFGLVSAVLLLILVL